MSNEKYRAYKKMLLVSPSDQRCWMIVEGGEENRAVAFDLTEADCERIVDLLNADEAVKAKTGGYDPEAVVTIRTVCDCGEYHKIEMYAKHLDHSKPYVFSCKCGGHASVYPEDWRY
jgi:hypothetical protein